MKRLLLALALLLPISAKAQMGLPLSNVGAFVPVTTPPSGCPQGAAYVDGCPGAPTGTAQQPSLLSSYAVRPPWNVAGVDFPTGYPTNITLADPSTISMSGVTVNATAHTVTVSGSNVTLSGYNFGLANGWEVIVTGANDTVQNSLFTVGTNQGSLGIVLNVSTAASNFSFLANEVNGSNIAVTAQEGFTLGFSNSGTLTIQWNYLHNSGGDMVEIQNGNWTNQLIRYNYFNNIGLNTAHSDTIQWCASKLAAGDVAFNTVNQTQTGLDGEGLTTLNSECTGSSIVNTTVRNNTLISNDSQDNFITGMTVTQDAGTAVGNNNAVYDNFTDPTGVLAYTGSPWFPTGYYGSALGTPGALHSLTNMVNNTQIAVPTKTAPTSQGYYVYPDSAGYSPSLSDILSITPSPATGDVTTGNSITFTLLMDAATTVTGTPTITLNSGGTATYTSGSGTKSLVFTYTVGSGDTASPLGVTAITGSMKDAVGNTTLLAPLTNLTTSFAGLQVNAGSALAFTVLNAAPVRTTTTGSGTYAGTVPTGLTNPSYGGGCSGIPSVTGFSASGGTWNATFTTPTVACTGTLTVTGVTNTATVTSPSTTFPASSGGAPSNITAPTVSSGTGFYSAGNTLTATNGTWNGAPTSYTYQWSRNGTAISKATEATYVLSGMNDVGETVTVTVTAINGSGSTPATSSATASIVGWPGQAGNGVGYANYGSGILGTTPWPGGSFSSGTSGSPVVYTGYKFTGNTSINCSFCNFIQDDFTSTSTTDATATISGSNILIAGSRFQSNDTGAGSGLGAAVNITGSNITFSYDSLTPLVSLYTSPPGAAWPSASAGLNTNVHVVGVNCIGGNDGYQYGLVINSAGTGIVIIDHLDGWGMGQDVVEYRYPTTAQMTLTNSWLHDNADESPNGYHSDGVGFMQGTAGPSNVLIQANTVAAIGNSDGLAWQQATSGYVNLQDIGNFFSGFGYSIASCGATNSFYCSNSKVSSNVWGTDVEPVFGPAYPHWTDTSNTWKCNTVRFLAGTTWNNGSFAPTSSMNGEYLTPTNTVSATDYNGNTSCP